MSLLDIDLSQTPDERPVIGAGVYNGTIISAELKPPKKAETLGSVLHVQLKLVNTNNGEHDGKEMTHYVFITSNPEVLNDPKKRANAFVDLKRLLLSAGVDPNMRPLDVSMLVGKTITFEVTNGVFTDPASGVTKKTYGIGKIFIPADNARVGASSPVGSTPTPTVSASEVLGG